MSQPQTAAAPPDEIVQRLVEEVVSISEGKLSPGEIDPKGDLFDYGYLSSLTAVIFLGRIEELFGVEIEDLELVEQYSTLHSVAERIRELG